MTFTRKYARLVSLVLALVITASLLLFSVTVAFAQEDSAGDTPAVAEGGRLCPVQFAAGSGEIEGTTYFCGTAFVPEDHANPDGPQIALTYMVLKSHSLAPKADPVIYLSGGPGSSALTEIVDDNNALRTVFDPIRQRRDLIVYDQRGSRFSDMLYCSPFMQIFDDLPEEIALRPEFVEFSQAFSALDAATQSATAYGTCGAGLLAMGRDITKYTSAQSAQDIPLVAKQAGYNGEVNLYGISYGTRLALTAMRDLPDTVRSVVLDSTEPPQLQNYETVATLYEEPFEQVFALCAANEACAAAYPDLEAHFIEVLNSMGDSGIQVSPPITVAGTLVGTYLAKTDVLDSIQTDWFVNIAEISNRSEAGGFWPLVPAAIEYLYAGDITTTVAILNNLIGSARSVTPNEQSPELQRLQELQANEANIQADINQALQQQLDESVASRLSSQWLQVVVTDYQTQTTAGDDMTMKQINLVWTPLYTNTAQTLVDFANLNLSQESAVAANQLVEQMSPEDIKETFEALRGTGSKIVGFDAELVRGQHYAIECYEEAPFQDANREAEIKAALPFPYLFNPKSQVQGVQKICQVFEATGAQAPEIENEPVVSNIPTLVYQGLIDTQTPASWGPQAARYLTNSTLIRVADSGHGVIQKTPCAQWIAANFFDDPEDEISQRCIPTTMNFLLPAAVEEWKAQQ